MDKTSADLHVSCNISQVGKDTLSPTGYETLIFIDHFIHITILEDLVVIFI